MEWRIIIHDNLRTAFGRLLSLVELESSEGGPLALREEGVLVSDSSAITVNVVLLTEKVLSRANTAYHRVGTA